MTQGHDKTRVLSRPQDGLHRMGTHLRQKVGADLRIVGTAIVLDVVVLAALIFEAGLACEEIFAYLAYPLFGLFGIVAAIACIGFSLRSGRKGIPLAILSVAVIGAFALIPVIQNWRRSLEFAIKRPGYMEVIDLVRQGLIEPGYKSLADIDPAHQ